jgi:hypothetical protein
VKAYSWTKDEQQEVVVSPGELLLSPIQLPAPLTFTSHTNTFIAHNDVIIHHMPETISHRSAEVAFYIRKQGTEWIRYPSISNFTGLMTVDC